MVGVVVGVCVGTTSGSKFVALVGVSVGDLVGTFVGNLVGTFVGSLVGTSVGKFVGMRVGTVVGVSVGENVVGATVGNSLFVGEAAAVEKS